MSLFTVYVDFKTCKLTVIVGVNHLRHDVLRDLGWVLQKSCLCAFDEQYVCSNRRLCCYQGERKNYHC